MLAGGAATATACKVAAVVVCATAITAGGAVEVRKLTPEPAPKRERVASDRGERQLRGGRRGRTPRAAPVFAPRARAAVRTRAQRRGTGRSAASAPRPGAARTARPSPRLRPRPPR